jgi:hypothetical protein
VGKEETELKKEKTAIKAVTKEKLLTIADLNAEKIKGMSNEQLQTYAESLNTSINLFPVQKEKLENAFRINDYAVVLQWLKSVRNRLSMMHADSLVKDCERQINQNQDLSNIRHDKLRAFIDYFFSNLNIFYTDIQHLFEEQKLEDIEHGNESPLEKIKGRLTMVNELNPKKIKAITSGQLCGYIDCLNAFAEDFEAQENGLKGSIKIKYYASTIQWLSVIEEALTKIYADNLAEECRNQINLNKDFDNIRHEKLEVFIQYLLTSLTILYDDIKKLNLSKLMQVSKHLSK